jgi:hypothetical protein
LDDVDKRQLAITEDNNKIIVRINGEVSEQLQQSLIKAAGKKTEQEIVSGDDQGNHL